jgi:hypothetical protein
VIAGTGGDAQLIEVAHEPAEGWTVREQDREMKKAKLRAARSRPSAATFVKLDQCNILPLWPEDGA